MACSKLSTKLRTNAHRSLVNFFGPGNPNPLPCWEVMPDHWDKSHTGSCKAALAGPKISFPTNAVYVPITYSQGRGHNRWGYLSVYSANKPFPLLSTVWAHRPCLFICLCAGTELVKTAGDSPEKRQEQVCPWGTLPHGLASP